MRSSVTLSLALAVALALAGCGKAAPTGLIIATITAKSAAPVVVRLTSGQTGGVIAGRNSAYGANLSPALAWTSVAGAGAYALVVEDPDAHAPRPFVHWLIWNIPESVSAR